MMIVDSQVHIWAAETPERPWLPGGMERIKHMGHRLEPIGYEELKDMMDAAGVRRCILVPPTWENDRIDLSVEAAEKYPDRFGVMARIPVQRPDDAKALIRSWRGVPGIKGVRLTFSFENEKDWITDGTADWYWPFAEENDIPTMLLVPDAKAKVAEVAERHPRLRLTIDHLGIRGNTTGPAAIPYVEATAALARFPNVSVKLSNLPSFSAEPFPYPDMTQHVERLVRAFGPRRCFWGTDLSRMLGKYGIGYREAIDQVMHHITILSDEEKEWIMGRAICDWLRWPA